MTALLQFVAQMVLGLLAVLALLLALTLADGSPVPAVAAIFVCCWAVHRWHHLTNRRRPRGRHA